MKPAQIKYIATLVVGLVAIGFQPPSTQAGESDSASVKKDIEALGDRIGQLEARLAAPEKKDMPELFRGLLLNGYVDASYLYNFEEPDPSVGRVNVGRVFDNDPNGFTPHGLVINVEKPVSNESPVGFKTTVFMGDDAERIHSIGAGTPTDQLDLQQVYVAAQPPGGKGLGLKLGKFNTLLGVEATSSPLNWNFSRSLLFWYAQPGTHTGALLSTPITDKVSMTAGIVNGWDIVDDNNSAKTFLGNLTVNSSETGSLAVSAISGAERAGDNHNARTAIDAVGCWMPFKRLSFMANYDYGWEGNLVPGTGAPGNSKAIWQGAALYAKYDLTSSWALAARGEWLDDRNNVRTAFTGVGGAVFAHTEYYEYTLTSQWTLCKQLLTRLEYRHDKANERVFFKKTNDFVNYQNTAALEFIVPF